MKRRHFLRSLIAALALAPVLCRAKDGLETYQEPEQPPTIELTQQMLDKVHADLISMSGGDWGSVYISREAAERLLKYL